MSQDARPDGFAASRIVSWKSSSEGGAGGAEQARAPGRIQPLAAGQALAGRFLIQAELGRGAMGVVYRARDLAAGRDVALKVLRGGVRPETRERLRREGEFTASLDHPGIVRIHAAGETDGLVYLVYELVEEAQVLEDLLCDAPLSERLRLLRDVALAVGHAHAHGIVHRDLKPANVLVDRQGRVRVADFGLAWAEGVDSLTLSGGMVGTPRFMAPEQFAGECGERGPPMDVWSVGVMLYMALTGEPPFPADSLQELAGKVLTAAPMPPREHDSAITPALEAVCLKAIEKRPTERYSDCRALAADLDLALEGRPVSASSGEWVRRHRPRLAKGTLVVALILLAALVGVLSWAAVREQGLRRELAAFRAGGPRAPLEALLAEGAQESALAAEAHLALAAGDVKTTDSAAWKSRLEHARRAIALGKEGGLARERAARALAKLGRHAKAAEAYACAFAQGGKAAALASQADEHIEAGELAEAEAAARAYIERRRASGARRQDGDGLNLLLRIQLRRRDASGARATFEERRARLLLLDSAVLEARVMAIEGRDPRPALRRAIRRWPKSPRPRLTLAWYLFHERGDVVGARATLAPELAPEDAETQDLAGDLNALLADPPDLARLGRASLERRAAAGGSLLSEGLREAAYARRAVDPRVRTPAGALPAKLREERARRRLRDALTLLPEGSSRAGRAQAALARLAPPDSPERRRRLKQALAGSPPGPLALYLRADERLRRGEAGAALADLDLAGLDVEDDLLLRGRALIALGRNEEAARALSSAAVDLAEACALRAQALAATGDDAAAAQLRERAGLLRGARRAEALALFRSARADKPAVDVMAEACAQALALDPLLYEAGYFHSRQVATQDARKGIREMIHAVSRCPELTTDMFRSMLSMSLATEVGRFRSRPLGGLANSLHLEDTSLDRLARATLLVFSVEYDRDRDSLEPGLTLLDEVLDDQPAESVAWLWRAVLYLRAGELKRAERDLRVAREALGDQGAVAFFEALLLAARGAPESEVKAKLLASRDRGFEAWRDDGWSVALYPRLAPFAGLSGLEFMDR